MMGLDATRVRAVVRKELRDYRRKRSIVVDDGRPAGHLSHRAHAHHLPHLGVHRDRPHLPWFFLSSLLLIPVITPSTLAAYSVVGEREQGTLEPLLTTPLRRQEFILGKAAAVMIPTVALSYAVFGLFLAVVRLFANPVVASAVFHQGPILLALFLFTPLLAGWAIVVGMAVSVRASEVRVAQQLGMLASFPPLGVVVLLGVGVIHPTFTAAVAFAVGLLAIDRLALRVVSRMFDRERLVTGAKATTSRLDPPVATAQYRDSRASKLRRNSHRGRGNPSSVQKIGRGHQPEQEWRIVMDGTTVGSIANQTRIEIPVEAGHHTLQLSSQKHLSPQRHFQAADGGNVSFSCHGLTLWPMYAAALLKPDLWISLKQD